MLTQEIVKSGMLKANTAFIVGSGPKGRSFYHLLPSVQVADQLVIACNRAILAPVDAHFWICEDATIPNQEWFLAAKKDPRSARSRRIFSDAIRDREPAEYRFEHRGIWKSGQNPVYSAGLTWGGGTVACRTLQLAAMSGVKRVVFVGVDMWGATYFDGDTNKTQTKKRTWKTWEQVAIFNEIIRWVVANTGVEIYTATESALECRKLQEVDRTEIDPDRSEMGLG